MEEKPLLIDKNISNIISSEVNIIEPKNQNEIPKTSLAYDFCKSLEEINSKNENGWSPIYKAVMSNNKQALNELLKLGADPNIQNNLGETPLYLCIENDNFELFKILLENGANPDIPKRNGDTPLHLIIKTKMDKKYLIEILKKNANPNIPNKLYEQTATHLALKNKLNEDVLVYFKKNKADIFNIKDKYDKSPFDYAKELNDDKYIEIINKIFLGNDEQDIVISEKNNTNNNDIKINNDLSNETKIEKKLDFDGEINNSEAKEKDNSSKKEEIKIELNKNSNEENININIIKETEKAKESSFDSLSKLDNENIIPSNKEFKVESENEKPLDNIFQQNEIKNEEINNNKNEQNININSEEKIEKEKNESNNKIKTNNSENKSSTKKIKDKEINIPSLSNNIKEKEINIDKPKILSNEEKNINKENFNKSESGISENEFEKLNYKLFKHLKNINKNKNGELNKNKLKNKNKSKKANIQNNIYYYEIKNNYESEKDISTIKNENSFSYEAKDTINESDINNNSNKENISLRSNLVYHNKNYLAKKDLNKSMKEKSFLSTFKPIYKKNENIIFNNKNKFRFSSPDFKLGSKSFNKNNLIISDNHNFLFNKIENSNTNGDIYRQYKKNNIIICKNKSTYNRVNYEKNSLNNTTFSSLRNNSRNNFNNKSGINRNSVTSNSFSNNSNLSFKNNSSMIINDYYNHGSTNIKYQINSYNILQNNILIKFRDWLITCDLLCYYNTLVKHNMYNIDKYINDIKLNKINVITFKTIEEFGIRKPGHIYRLLLKIQIDAGKIDNNIYKFIIDKFSVNTMTNNGAMTTSFNDINCFGLNCFLSNSNNGFNYTNNKIGNNNYNENCINYFDIFSFLKVNNMWRFKENFIHNGFDQIDYVLIQLFSKYTFDKKILNDYLHIYLEEDKNFILKILYKEKKKLSNLMGLEYNDEEIKNILSYTQNASSLNESYINNNGQNNHNNCCFIF